MGTTEASELLTIAGMKAEFCAVPTHRARSAVNSKWGGLIEAIKSLPDGSALRLYPTNNPKSVQARISQLFGTGLGRHWRDEHKRQIHVHRCEGTIVVWHSAAKEPPHATES